MVPSLSSKSSLDDKVAAETGLEGFEMSPETKTTYKITDYKKQYFITVNHAEVLNWEISEVTNLLSM